MKWGLNFLVKILGAFLTSISVYGTINMYSCVTCDHPLGWSIGALTIGLALLFAPKIEMK